MFKRQTDRQRERGGGGGGRQGGMKKYVRKEEMRHVSSKSLKEAKLNRTKKEEDAMGREKYKEDGRKGK